MMVRSKASYEKEYEEDNVLAKIVPRVVVQEDESRLNLEVPNKIVSVSYYYYF